MIANSVMIPALIATVALIRRRSVPSTRSLAAVSSRRRFAASSDIRSVRNFPCDCCAYASRESGFRSSGSATVRSHSSWRCRMSSTVATAFGIAAVRSPSSSARACRPNAGFGGLSTSRNVGFRVDMKPRSEVSSANWICKRASRSERACANRTWAPDAASSWRTPISGPARAVARNAATSRTIGGDAQNRTGGGAFAELCLTTWLRRPERLSGWRESNPRINLGKVAGYHYITPAPDGRTFSTPRCEPWRRRKRSLWVRLIAEPHRRSPGGPMKRLLALALTLALAALGGAAPAAAQSDAQVEMQIGQQEYQALAQKGEIISSSPYYAILNPIAQQIKRVADPQYPTHPFQFILVHETQPNAFAVPGGNVYVTDSLMRFVQNREELAGVLCHETSHTIHHDVMNNYVKNQRLSMYAGLASLLFGGGRSQVANAIIENVAGLQSLTFSRDVEHNADHTGAYLCAQAAINPNGMIWLFDKFEQNPTGAPPEALSDH